jgi:hypothetical protein
VKKLFLSAHKNYLCDITISQLHDSQSLTQENMAMSPAESRRPAAIYLNP